jgi:ABC-type multidrug transport system permease subunit
MILFSNIGIQFVIEKQHGIHKRLILSAIHKKQLVGVYLTKGLILSFVCLAEILLIARFVFNMTITNNLPLFLLVYVILLALLLLISISLHDLFKSQKQVVPFTIGTFQYVLLCSGLMFPITDAPNFLVPLIYTNPFYQMNEIFVSVWAGKVNEISLLGLSYLAVVTVACLLLVRYSSLRKEA